MRKSPLLLLCALFFFQKTVQAQNAHQPDFSPKSAFQPTTTLAEILQKSIKNWLPIAENWENQAIEHTSTQAKNLIVITTDGLRWQEVFEGAAGRTREDLMPFFWKKLAAAGQVYGNRNHGSAVRVSNRTQISYPGYSELICGFADDERVLLNTRKSNPNRHVFEWLNRQRGFRGRVAVFGSWDLFPYIFNEKRSKVEVNAAFEKIENPRFAGQNKLNQQLETVKKRWKNHLRPDTLTWAFAKNQMKIHHPRAVFIGFGETDEFAHEGDFEGYLQAISRFDSLLREVWDFVESDEKYRDKTALVVTTDHGRGRKNWRSHHPMNPGSDETWLAVASPDLETKGEIRQPTDLRACQFAQMMSRLLGLKYENPDRRPADAPAIIFEKMPQPDLFEIPNPEPVSAAAELQTQAKK